MVNKLSSLAKQIASQGAAVIGVRWGTEEPRFTVQDSTHGLQIRRYGSRVAAQTVVAPGDGDDGLDTGFRRLAGYIFGGNNSRTHIAMTAPVSRQPGQKIDMTVPVEQARNAAGGSVVQFFMPAQWAVDTLPQPNDDTVQIVEVPAQTVAVLKFTGRRDRDTVALRQTDLVDALRYTDLQVDGEPVAWFYDPPWTLPFRRRNEVAVPVIPA